MVGQHVERFKVHVDLIFFCHLCAVLQGVEHCAELHGVGQLSVVVDNYAAIAQRIRVDGYAQSTDLLAALQDSSSASRYCCFWDGSTSE